MMEGRLVYFGSLPILVYTCDAGKENRRFHFRWGTKPRHQKQETGNDCDVNLGLQAYGSKNTHTNNAWAILTPFVYGMTATLKLKPQTAFYLFTGFIAFLLQLM